MLLSLRLVSPHSDHNFAQFFDLVQGQYICVAVFGEMDAGEHEFLQLPDSVRVFRCSAKDGRVFAPKGEEHTGLLHAVNGWNKTEGTGAQVLGGD